MNKLVAVTPLALCFVFMFCNGGDSQTRPSGLIGQWELAREVSGKWTKKTELLKDGTGIDDGVSITWKVDGNRFFTFGLGEASGMYYKISGYELLLWTEEDTAIYVRKGKLEEYNAKQEAEKVKQAAAAEAEKAKQIADAKKFAEKAKASVSTFKDSRDGKTYKKVTIGAKTWMAENLNYAANSSVCYENNTGNCEKYGHLYNWEAAKKACPAGWHLPSDAEWTTLTDNVGGKDIAGKKLKSTAGWNENGNGSDEYAFSALPGGDGISDIDFFDYADSLGNWWSATEYDADGAYNRRMSYDSDEVVVWGNGYKTRLFSVRCVQD